MRSRILHTVPGQDVTELREVSITSLRLLDARTSDSYQYHGFPYHRTTIQSRLNGVLPRVPHLRVPNRVHLAEATIGKISRCVTSPSEMITAG